jgi:hypothetical protein
MSELQQQKVYSATQLEGRHVKKAPVARIILFLITLGTTVVAALLAWET